MLALVAVIIGGAGSLWGPCLGAAVVVLVRDEIGPSLGGHGPLLLGLVFILAVYLLPGGIAGRLRAALRGRPRMTRCSSSPVSPRLGGLRAVDGVNLDVEAGARHGLIGPNGAGKSTLFKLILGALARPRRPVALRRAGHHPACPSTSASGSASRRPSSTPACSRASLLENVLLALQRRTGDARGVSGGRSRALAQADALLERVGLEAPARAPAAALSHGERRQLEVAVALATEPRLLLLDEPAAGHVAGGDGAARGDHRGAAGRARLLIVEHDLDLVFRSPRDVTVLHLGGILMTGPPEQVRAYEEVRARLPRRRVRRGAVRRGGGDGWRCSRSAASSPATGRHGAARASTSSSTEGGQVPSSAATASARRTLMHADRGWCARVPAASASTGRSWPGGAPT